MEIQGVAHSVTQHLRKEIILSTLAPGLRLNEIELAERLGVSRPPLREAFRKLESENLVVSIPRKGSYVASMSVEDCIHIYRARIMLECAAIDIMEEQGLTDLSHIEKTLEAEHSFRPKVLLQPDLLDYFNIMSGFHNELVKACANRWVIHYHCQIRPTMARYQVMYLRLPGTRQLSLTEHEEVFGCIRKGCYAEAKEKIAKHILRARGAIIQGITTAQPAPNAATA